MSKGKASGKGLAIQVRFDSAQLLTGAITRFIL